MRRHILALLLLASLFCGLGACSNGSVELNGDKDGQVNAGEDGDSAVPGADGDYFSESDHPAPNGFYAPMLADPAYLPNVFGSALQSQSLDFAETRAATLPAKAAYLPFVFDALPGARVNVSVAGAGHTGVGLALYGPRGSNGLWGAAIAQSAPGEGLLLLGEVALPSYGQYLLLVISPGLDGPLELRLSLGCRGRCGEPPCPDDYQHCQSFCEAGFALDARGCETCVCSKPNHGCLNDAACEVGQTCLNGLCTKGNTEQNPCTSNADCGNAEQCKDGYCSQVGSETSPCKADGDCPTGQVCLSQTGYCGVKSDPCGCQNEGYAPVCGTDKVLYSNACEAKCAGVAVLGDKTLCGVLGGCSLDSDCPTEQVCVAGVCQTPKSCNCETTFVPVCGVDGKTYTNLCELKCQGLTLLHDGICGNQENCPPLCTIDSAGNQGWLNSCTGEMMLKANCKLDCKTACQNAGSRSEGWYNLCDGSLVTYADCAAGCGCSPQSDPVCGADGKTYNNACEAACAQVSVVYKNTCQTTINGCSSAQECPTGQVCVNPCTDASSADCRGVCQTSSDSASCKSDADCASGQSCVPLAGYNGNGTCQANDCQPTGCFLEICAGYAAASACQYAPAFDCLHLLTCGKNAAGTCTWNDASGGAYEACMNPQKAAPACAKDGDCGAGVLCLDGVCRPGDCACPEAREEVCAAQTYANFCQALCAGATVSMGGACQ